MIFIIIIHKMQIYTRLKPPPVYLLRKKNKEETSETNYSIVDVNWATLNCLGFASIQKYSTELLRHKDIIR